MDTGNDYYAVLGVLPSADATAIRTAYRILAQKHHPDRVGGDPGAVAKMARINEAYRILGDSQRREEYDRTRKPQPSEAPPSPDSSPSPVQQPERYGPELHRRSRRRRPNRVKQPAKQVAGCAVALLVAFGALLFVSLLFIWQPGKYDDSPIQSEQIDDFDMSAGRNWEFLPQDYSESFGDEHLDSYSEPIQPDISDRWESGPDWESPDAGRWDSWNQQDPEPILP